MQGIPNNTALAIHITDQCNLRCPGCYTLNQERTRTIEWDYIKKALDIYHPIDVVFFGGEAILKPELIRRTMEEYPDIRYSLHTNGTNYIEENKDIYNNLYKVIVSLDSFRAEWLRENKKYTDIDILRYNNLLKEQRDKISVTHNIFASNNDKYYADDMNLYKFPTDWYLFVTKSRDQQFLHYFRTHMINMNPNLNVLPKLRLLTDGTITRDMRGIYNLFHVTQWNKNSLNEPLPVSDKCQQCPYMTKCHSCLMFPHFVKDILDAVTYEPHFCKFTKIFWRYCYGI